MKDKDIIFFYLHHGFEGNYLEHYLNGLSDFRFIYFEDNTLSISNASKFFLQNWDGAMIDDLDEVPIKVAFRVKKLKDETIQQIRSWQTLQIL